MKFNKIFALVLEVYIYFDLIYWPTIKKFYGVLYRFLF